jgi:hypothetical protein
MSVLKVLSLPTQQLCLPALVSLREERKRQSNNGQTQTQFEIDRTRRTRLLRYQCAHRFELLSTVDRVPNGQANAKRKKSKVQPAHTLLRVSRMTGVVPDVAARVPSPSARSRPPSTWRACERERDRERENERVNRRMQCNERDDVTTERSCVLATCASFSFVRINCTCSLIAIEKQNEISNQRAKETVSTSTGDRRVRFDALLLQCGVVAATTTSA